MSPPLQATSKNEHGKVKNRQTRANNSVQIYFIKTPVQMTLILNPEQNNWQKHSDLFAIEKFAAGNN